MNEQIKTQDLTNVARSEKVDKQQKNYQHRNPNETKLGYYHWKLTFKWSALYWLGKI